MTRGTAEEGEVEAEGLELLLVEDDGPLRERLARALRDRGCEVRTAATQLEAIALACEAPVLQAVVDLKLPDGSGLDVLRTLRSLQPAARVLMFTGYGTIDTATEAVRRGAVGFLTKPANADEVLQALGVEARSEGAPPAPVASLETAEREHIERVLRDCGGNISAAARLLGLHRRSLQRKLRRLDEEG